MADQAKLEADQAFKEGRSADAVRLYTTALEQNVLNGTSPKHTLLSNRSAAYCKLQQFDKALEDALACISCSPSFAKVLNLFESDPAFPDRFLQGYSRKAAALHGKGDLQGALQAYKKVIALDSSNEAAKSEAAKIEAILSSSSSSSTSSGAQPQRGYQPSRDSSVKSTGWKWMDVILLLAQIYSVVNSILVVFMTDPSESRHVFGRAIFSALIGFLGQAVTRHGLPSLSTFGTLWKAFRSKATQAEVRDIANFAMDNNTHNIFYCTLTMSAAPSLLLLIPLVLENGLSISRRVRTLASSFPSLTAFANSATDKVLGRETDIRKMVCNAEVLIFFALIFELFTPRRNILLLVLYAQLLRVRYIVHADSRAAWAAVTQRADGVLLHHKSPSFVQAGYRKLKSLAGGLVQQAHP